MSVFDDIADVSVALAEGIYSVGQDLVYGLERSIEGAGSSGMDRIAEIGFENEALAGHLADLVRFGFSERSPLFKIVLTILEQYYEKVPEHILEKIGRKAGINVGYAGGRMIVGKEIAKRMAVKIAKKIATTAAYKQFAKKLGVSAGASSTGVGIPIALLMFQGVAQRASQASERLRKYNTLYTILRFKQKRLDLLFFLVEKPLEKHLKVIEFADKNRPEFERQIKKLEINLDR